MTVAQLITELQKLPDQNLPVLVEDGFDPSDREELRDVRTLQVECPYGLGNLKQGQTYIYLST